MRLRQSQHADFSAICAVINEAAQAYRGVIPIDRWQSRLCATPMSGRRRREKAWSIRARQIETSVVLADSRWTET
jgi:hypothetical protein